jgi:hypothetical protein
MTTWMTNHFKGIMNFFLILCLVIAIVTLASMNRDMVRNDLYMLKMNIITWME